MTVDKKNKKSIFFKNSIDISEDQTRLLNLFVYTMLTTTIISMLGVILFYAHSLAAMYNGVPSELSLWLLGIFSDFVEIMNFSLDDSPYVDGVGSSYPPLAIAVLYPFALICKGAFAKYNGETFEDINELTSKIACHWEFWLALVLFFCISIFSIAYIASRICRFNFKNSVKLTLAIAFSGPFVYAIMRGNTIYFALIFVLLFLLLYKSENPVLREIALLSLAFAGCLKLYPLFFGVFLLKDKKIFASVRVAVYFALMFFIPFLFISGNEGGANPFVENLQGFMSDAERLLNFRNLSITALLYKTVYVFSHSAAESQAFDIVNLVILILVFLAATVLAVCAKSNFSRAVICTGIIILIPSVTYFYVLIFMIIPFMEYFKNYDSIPKKERIMYLALFMFIAITPIMIPQFYIPHALIVIFIMCYEGTKVIRKDIIPFFKNRKKLKEA